MATDVAATESLDRVKEVEALCRSLSTLINVGDYLGSRLYYIREKPSRPTDSDWLLAESDEAVPNNGSWASLLRDVKRGIDEWWKQWRIISTQLRLIPTDFVTTEFVGALRDVPTAIAATEAANWPSFVNGLGSMDQWNEQRTKLVEHLNSLENWGVVQSIAGKKTPRVKTPKRTTALSPTEKKVSILSQSGLKPGQIAAKTGQSAGAVRVAKHRAKKKIQEASTVKTLHR
jgi:DNA-binding CsgD family transcriptional regulator